MSKEMRSLIDSVKKITNESFNNNNNIPKYLYHATFKPLLGKIKLEGLGGTSSKKLWSDSKNNTVYLAKEEDVAISYAETAFDENEHLPESWVEKIIVLVIDTDLLDKNNFSIDKNVIDNMGDTLEYSGIIPFTAIVNIIKV